MPQFLKLIPPNEALSTYLEKIETEADIEISETEAALGRVIAEDITAPHALPNFPRSTVDGYAVKALNTHGASDSLPAYLIIIGEVPMGNTPHFEVGSEESAVIHTGGMLPEGANAVVMVEYTQEPKEGQVEISKSVAAGENVIQVGEDVKTGEMVIPAGRLIRPYEIGGLLAYGITSVKVAVRPIVGIISTGDEVVPPNEETNLGQVRDINSYTLSALVNEAGGIAKQYGIIKDDGDAIKSAAEQALEECEMVILTAGSSVSVRDLTGGIIDSLGEPGVLVHGVNIRPGKPTILGICDGKPVIGLPGNPVSALVIAGLFVKPVIKKLMGQHQLEQKAVIQAKLGLDLSSISGREDWIAVRIIKSGDEIITEPVLGKSNLIFTLARADGLIRIPADANGLSAGEIVDVHLLD